MKRFYLSSLFLCLVLALSAQGKAKYIFYFIGDGMGLEHVNVTEMYLGELNGEIKAKPLTFSSFPVATMANTYSKTNSVTDSSAAGTALATGVKTYNGAIGVDVNKDALESVAARAKKSGKSVGVITSVSVDHATPAAFYAHQPDRNMYYEIALDLPKAGFDFYGGAGFLNPEKKDGDKVLLSAYDVFSKAGYTLYRGLDEYENKTKGTKTILVQEEGKEKSALPYAIDREEDDLSLRDITKSAIAELSKNKKGFFLMVEGGKIDWASHDNDAATVVHEVLDLDEAVKEAFKFYKKHPKETLIVVTADHETGGMSLGTGQYKLNLKALKYQKVSAYELSNLISNLRKENDNDVSWEQMKELLADNLGFWDELDLTWNQEKKLRDEFEHSFVEGKHSFEKSMYTKTEPLAARAKEVLNEIAMISWASHSHSANFVPVYAIGVGADLFKGGVDNIEIPQKIGEVGRYKK